MRDRTHAPLIIFFIAITAILAPERPFSAESTSETAATVPNLGATPDLGGLLAATKKMEMREALPGLSTGSASYPAFGVTIHVVDVDPARFAFRIVEQNAPTGSVANEMLHGEADVFAINAGFFERDQQRILTPSGLLIAGGETLAEEHERAGSGVFYSDGTTVGIAYRKDLTDKAAIREAVQVGPVLVDPGGVKGIPKDMPDRHNRSAVCLRDGRVSFFLVEGGLSLFQLADLLSLKSPDGGFGCDVALNLDGGPSTQASFRAGNSSFEVPGSAPVQNFIIVASRL